ncbi:hypothetical protein WJ969_08020 [Achromobacter xylosoxidans]
MAQFQEIAQRNPSRGEPWSYIAKIRFDEQKYGEAIVAADEALNRDSNDFTAKTVRAVGGLRVAMQSLADLRADALLAGNARSDAVALAAAMRETLGQDVLFPEAAARRRHAPAAQATQRQRGRHGHARRGHHRRRYGGDPFGRHAGRQRRRRGQAGSIRRRHAAGPDLCPSRGPRAGSVRQSPQTLIGPPDPAGRGRLPSSIRIRLEPPWLRKKAFRKTPESTPAARPVDL